MNPSETIWDAAEKAVVAGDITALKLLLRDHAAMFRDKRPESSWLGGLAPDYSSADARSTSPGNITSRASMNSHDTSKR